jgi:EAL domain-containing protein (putative c-di-GMP-specific phosphodiesterase class I)
LKNLDGTEAMNDKKPDDYVSANIYKHFYFNDQVSSPTLIKEYPSIEKILVHSRYIACITIQITQLGRIEYQYGSTAYNRLLGEVMDIIRKLKVETFRDTDILIVDLFDVDTFMIFLSPPREDDTKLLDHLEKIAERTRVIIERDVFDLFYPYTKEYIKPAVGCALAINNSMINNMRLITQLVSNAKKMGEFAATKNDFATKFSLQKLIIEEDVQTLFQPVVDMQTLEIIGYEALSRGPKGSELASPLLMFVLAQKFDLSFELDTLCRKRAFEKARHLDSDKKIFVNTLTMTIHDPEFRGQYLKQLLADLKIKPSNVVFEINEKLAIDNYELFRSSLQDYSDIGIVHASDDIGTGYSDLERIMELSPGFMKIDISLVRDIDNSIIKQEIVKAMVNLAKGINSVVIAEGIETRAEYEKLREMGIGFGQGYLFGRPSDELAPINKDFLNN